MLTVLWMTGTATTAARQATAFPLHTTPPCSPMPLCTSSRAQPACSSREFCGIPVPTPSRIMIWIIGSMWLSGECCFIGSSPFPIVFPLQAMKVLSCQGRADQGLYKSSDRRTLCMLLTLEFCCEHGKTHEGMSSRSQFRQLPLKDMLNFWSFNFGCTFPILSEG